MQIDIPVFTFSTYPIDFDQVPPLAPSFDAKIRVYMRTFFFACPPNVPLTAHSIYIIFWTRLGDFLFSKPFPNEVKFTRIPLDYPQAQQNKLNDNFTSLGMFLRTKNHLIWSRKLCKLSGRSKAHLGDRQKKNSH